MNKPQTYGGHFFLDLLYLGNSGGSPTQIGGREAIIVYECTSHPSNIKT